MSEEQSTAFVRWWCDPDNRRRVKEDFDVMHAVRAVRPWGNVPLHVVIARGRRAAAEEDGRPYLELVKPNSEASPTPVSSDEKPPLILGP